MRIKAAGKLLVVEPGAEGFKLAQFRNGRLAGIRWVPFSASPWEDAPGQLADVSGNAGFSRENTIVCIPRQLVNVRGMDLPSNDPEEIDAMIDLQIGRQTPYAREDIVFDYVYAGEGRNGCARVLLVIVQRAVLEIRLHVLESAGFDVARITFGSEGLWNSYMSSGLMQGDTTALLDVDVASSDFIVVEGGRMIFTRGIMHGYNPVSAGSLPDWCETMAREIRNAFDACAGETGGVQPSGLVVTGVHGRLKEICSCLSGKLNIRVEPMATMSAGDKADTSSADCGSWASMCGLGRKISPLSLNLVPDTVALRRAVGEKARRLTTMSVLVITLMVLMSLWVGIRATVLVHDRHLIGVDNALVKAEADAVRRKKGITLKAAMRAGRMFDTVGILAGVREAVPDDGALLLDSVDLNISDGRFVVGGTAETRKEIGVFVRNLEQHDLLFNVKESGATGKGRDDRYRFQIAGQIGESDDS